MAQRCERNRKRSKRRYIRCPLHNCLIESVSQKHFLFADTAAQLKLCGVSKRRAAELLNSRSAVSLKGEWLEAFWCMDCLGNTWYRVRKVEDNYLLAAVEGGLWQQAIGVIDPGGNPSVSEFSKRAAKRSQVVW